MKRIDAAFKRYNINAQDKSVGDCVKRALAYAFGMDYNEVGRELNKIKRDIGGTAFNTTRVFTKFLKDHGAVKLNTLEENQGAIEVPEEEFASEHPHGIYILLTGPANKGYSTHMVCVMNGDIIDSWNSSNYVVYDVWKVPESVSTDTYDVTWEDVEDELNSLIDDYIQKINKKANGWFEAWREDGHRLDAYTYDMKFYVRLGDVPEDSEFRPFTKHVKYIVVKINPRMSLEQNLTSLKAKLKQSVYDWLYPYMKDKKDTEAIQNMETHERYYKSSYAKKDLLKLPEWCRKYVKYFWVPASYGYQEFELSMDALPDDPYVEDRGSNLRFVAESMKELKEMLEDYRTKYERPGWDY